MCPGILPATGDDVIDPGPGPIQLDFELGHGLLSLTDSHTISWNNGYMIRESQQRGHLHAEMGRTSSSFVALAPLVPLMLPSQNTAQGPVHGLAHLQREQRPTWHPRSHR